MPTIRVPIWKLLTLVALVAVAIAALRQPTDLTAGYVFSLTVGVLLFALIGTIARQGNGRLPSLGFVTFGTGYLVLAFLGGGIREMPPLPTKLLMDWAALRLLPRPYEPFPSIFPDVPTGGPASILDSNRMHFEQIGHSFIALLMGLFGSLLARLFRVEYDGTQPPGRPRGTL